jgi:RNA polymerase sigma-70 factor (ECF subfamily)
MNHVLEHKPATSPQAEDKERPRRPAYTVMDIAPEAARQLGAERVRAIVHAHYTFLWRSLRRLGVPEASVEDAAQKTLCVIAQRIDDIAPGMEKTFLFGVALHVAQATRREQKWREVNDDQLLAELPATGPDPDQELDDRRARALLDALLESIPLDLRTVFILYELEEMTMAEIALALDIPSGTVASRLRRARDAFDVLSRRVQARVVRNGGNR